MALCIPDYGWAPGVSGPPDWISDPAAGGDPSLRDPRWVSAMRLSANNTSGEEFFIRAVRNSATNRLYLSAWVQYGPTSTFNTIDRLWVGFKPAAGTPQVLAFNYTNTTDEAASPNLTTTRLEWNGTTWANPGTPAGWVTDARVWKEVVDGHVTWAFQMVIDIAGAGLSPAFGMCFQAKVQSAHMATIYHFPEGMPFITGTLDASELDPANAAHWQSFTYTGGSCDPGVTIDWTRIGTTNTPTHLINRSAPNTFQARPRNDTTGPVNIRARFRLANWGSTPTQAWRDLFVTPGDNVAASSDGLLAGNWQPNSSRLVPLPTPPGGSLDEVSFYNINYHQCMMVVLEAVSGSVYFSRDSCVRNMDFDHTSKLERKAEISLRGLEDGYPLTRRNVYVSVERVNVPPVVDAATAAKYEQVQAVYKVVNDLSQGFSPAQRYVALLIGDLRHLRYIQMNELLSWALANHREEKLLVSDQLFTRLRPFGVEASGFSELIDRYAGTVLEFHAQLSYDQQGWPMPGSTARQIIQILRETLRYEGEVTLPEPSIPPIADLEDYIPMVRYHVFRDTGLRVEVDGVVLPVVEPQPSFGFYLWLDHEVQRWELRLRGAEKLAENLYLIRPETGRESEVITVIHAVAPGEEGQIDPPEPIIAPPKYSLNIKDEEQPGATGCLEALARFFDGLGPVGRAIAALLRSLGS